MGRSAKRYISIITVLLVMLMPMSTAFAAISSLFSHSTETQSHSIELAADYQHNHDSLELVIDGATTLVDETVVHDLLLTDNSHENQGSGGVNVSIFTQISSDSADWNYVYLDDGVSYELTSVSLPAEIRPPIYL